MRTLFKLFSILCISLFVIILIGAYFTAIGTTGAWYGPEISLWTYGSSLQALIVFLVAMLIAIMIRRQHLEKQVHILEDNIRMLISKIENLSASDWQAFEDGIRDSFEREHLIIASRDIGLERASHTADLPAKDAERIGLEELAPIIEKNDAQWISFAVRKRNNLLIARREIWKVMAGPIIMALIMITICAIFLPLSTSFAQENFQLNTALVLIVSYGSALLPTYMVASFLALVYSE